MRKIHIPIIVLLVVVSVITYWNLFHKNGDIVLFYELRAISHDLDIEDLCDPNPLSGLEGHTPNVGTRRMTSIFYSLPTKLLYDTGVPLHLLHRSIGFLIFLATLVVLYLISKELLLSLPVRLLLVIYYGLSEQVLMPLVAAHSAGVSILWFAIILLLYLKLLASLSNHLRRFSFCWIRNIYCGSTFGVDASVVSWFSVFIFRAANKAISLNGIVVGI